MRKHAKFGTVVCLALGLWSSAHAGTEAKETVVVEEKPKVVSGWISFDYNTHFVSYGLDVWGGGQSWRRGTFNPSAQISLAVPQVPNLSLIAGTWWDINNYAVSSIGNRIQEIDIWAGASYSYGPVSATLLYQAWNYGGSTEQIIDLTIGVDCLLKPTLVIHGRPDAGAAGGAGESAGVFFVPGISHSVELGPVTVTGSVNVGFCTEDFHAADGGYAYTAVGLGASVPVPFLPGDWDFHFGVTYYNTNDDVIPANVDDNFVTGNIGMKLSF